jgi:hypothetical protein
MQHQLAAGPGRLTGDIAAAVAFLVGADGAWINDRVLRADGGTI